MKTIWDQIKDLYLTYYGVPGIIIDYISIIDILKACASGLSNKSIANYFGITEQDVKEDLEFGFEFTGFLKDLDINPLMVYNRTNKDFIAFCIGVRTITPLVTDSELTTCFNLCKKYYGIERIIINAEESIA